MPTGTLLQGALKVSGKYSAEKIKACFKTYNMIIYTSQGIYDTTVYNLCDAYSNTPLHTEVAKQSTNTLVLGYNPNGEDATAIPDASKIDPSYKYIEIAEGTIQKVIIKSKRNFLPNQKPIAKTL